MRKNEAQLKADREKMKTSFRLRPFTPGPLLEKLTITGSITRVPGTLLIEYDVRGPIENISRPGEVLPQPKRCDELWRHTCFELFFGIKDDPGYWEVNFCPSGRWNVYRFDGYRKGMREENSMARPLCHVTEDSEVLSLQCSLPINGIVDDSSTLEAVVSAVIETIDTTTHHWAIEHMGPEPNFHNRDSFLLILPGLAGTI